MLDTRNPSRPNARTFSRSYIAPELAAHLAEGGAVGEWLAGRTPIASYARISSDRLEGDAIGIGRQHNNNKDNAAPLKCAIVLHYEDNNITAAKREITRPAFVQMCKDLSLGFEGETKIPIQGVIAVERERVYRLPRDFVAFQDALIMNRAGVFIDDRNFLDLVNDDGNIISGLVTAGTGEAEVKKTRKRVIRNTKDLAKEGAVYAGPRRFGWLGPDNKTGRRGNEKIDVSEWPYLVSLIKQAYANKGWRTMTSYMSLSPMKTVRGNDVWNDATIKFMVTSPAWWGGRILDGKIVTDKKGDPVIGDWEHATMERDGIGYETWLAIMERINSKRHSRGMAQDAPTREVMRTGKYVWSGFLRCGRINKIGHICYSKITATPSSGRNRKYGPAYLCRSPACKGVGRKLAAVELYLDSLVLAYLDKHFSDTEPSTVPWSSEKELENLREQLSSVEASISSGEIAWTDAHNVLTQLQSGIRKLEGERAAHLEAEAKRNLVRGWKRERWDMMDVSQKRAVIGQVISAVVVMPIPEGTSKKAPFNPDLLKVAWRKDEAA
ncbi:recombinase family protein [Streptomyces sp. NPDC006684]|uniref:recombinase family protein n=1 Tax=Streptomyces sp. NPDC006684 TaxID=3154477 RepID=UPI00345632E6